MPITIEIMTAIEDYGLDVVQLHGDESPELCDDAFGRSGSDQSILHWQCKCTY